MQKIRVVDVPSSAAASEAESLLNAPCAEGFYPWYQSALPDGVRFFYKLRTKPD